MCPRVSAEYKERRRQTILDAALAVFIGKGYQLTTIDDIAARSGLSVGAIYRYFSTKGEIMLTLVEQRLGRTPELFARLTAEVPDPWERMVRCVDLFVSALRVKHPETARLLLAAWAEALQDGQVRQGLHRRFAGLVEYLGETIRAGQSQGRFRTDTNPEGLAAVLLCTADAVTLYWVTQTPGVDIRLMRQIVLGMLRSYLLTQPTPEE